MRVRGERKTHLAPPAAASLNEHTARLREMRLALTRCH